MSKKNLKKESVWVAGGHTASWGSAKTSLTFCYISVFSWLVKLVFLSPQPHSHIKQKDKCISPECSAIFPENCISCLCLYVFSSGKHEGFLINRVKKHPYIQAEPHCPGTPGLSSHVPQDVTQLPFLLTENAIVDTTASKWLVVVLPTSSGNCP